MEADFAADIQDIHADSFLAADRAVGECPVLVVEPAGAVVALSVESAFVAETEMLFVDWMKGQKLLEVPGMLVEFVVGSLAAEMMEVHDNSMVELENWVLDFEEDLNWEELSFELAFVVEHWGHKAAFAADFLAFLLNVVDDSYDSCAFLALADLHSDPLSLAVVKRVVAKKMKKKKISRLNLNG